MDIRARQGRKNKGNLTCSGYAGAFCLALCGLFLTVPVSLLAQGQGAVEEIETESTEDVIEIEVSLPGTHQMLLSLATPLLRTEALLDLAAAASVLSRSKQEVAADQVTLAQQFVADRTWLAGLVERYGWARPRSSVLDPAAWLVVAELQQHNLEAGALVFPGGTSEAMLLYQVFQRSGERLAVANLPGLLQKLEAEAGYIWDEFLQLNSPGGTPHPAWGTAEAIWFANRPLPPLPSGDKASQIQQLVIENIPEAMSQLVLSTVDARPPDSTRLVRIRYTLMMGLPETAGQDTAAESVDGTGSKWPGSQTLARDMLYLASLVDGLHDGRYFDFVQGLLSITTGLLEQSAWFDQKSPVVEWLVTELPAISAHYAGDIATVDPRLNATITASYGVLQSIARTEGIATASPNLRASLANAVAQLTLLIPDMGYYFDTPVRTRVAEEIDICTSIAASRDAQGNPAMTRRQFDGCVENLLQLAEQETRLAELSGDMRGPFTSEALRRELNVTSGQRINYGIGYLHDRYKSDCQPPATALPNPLEWAVLATTMAWLAEHSPEFFLTTQNESHLTRMRSVGEQLVQGLTEQAECFAGATLNDPVARSLTDYETALRQLSSGMDEAEADFRTRRLRPGADISLDKDATQNTAYRPDDLVIEPCNLRSVCEMSGNLSTTRALIGLFGEKHLVAEQSGMGHLEICYRNMEWVQRRSELVRPDDKNVANYYGHLGFDLVGRYIENERASDIFSFRFTSPEEHHYLFAQASVEVLDDSCPIEWVGSRVITPLPEGRGSIVPNRLTYLAAARALPSRLLQNNWDRGAEWRDWFVTGIGVEPLVTPPVAEISIRLNQHLQSLYQAEQAEIYQRILLPSARNAEGEPVSLYDEISQVSTSKALIRMQMMLFYPESLFNSDPIRMAIAGDAGLLEGRTLRRFREHNVALTSVNQVALQRLQRLRQNWLEQPEAVRRKGSTPTSLMHALTRINIVYRQLFTSRPEPLEETQAEVAVENGA